MATNLSLGPSIHDLGVETGALETAEQDLSHADLEDLIRDLSIWIAEHYYQPKTQAEVKQLKPGLHQGGLEYLLRYLLEQEDERLRDREYELLASRIESWIEFIWDSDAAGLTHALKKQGSTGQLVAWLDETCWEWFDSSLEPVIERLKQQAP